MTSVYVYGMRTHGFAPGMQPEEGWLDTETDPLEEYFNVVLYNRKLKREEMERYGLDFLGKREQE